MKRNKSALFPAVQSFIAQIKTISFSKERLAILQDIGAYVNERIVANATPQLHFICTHNSRRSQLCQVWSKVLADFYGVNLLTYSGGTEVTSVPPQVIQAMEDSGLKVTFTDESNAAQRIAYSGTAPPITLSSKLYNAPENPTSNFAAVMTCSQADNNCPFIPGAEMRFALHYPDPKLDDGSPQEAETYANCNRQIAAEMAFLIQIVAKQNLHV